MEEQEEEGKRTKRREDAPLLALAPDASLPEEQPSASTDISASPAFQCLDEVRLVNVLWHFRAFIWKINLTFVGVEVAVFTVIT